MIESLQVREEPADQPAIDTLMRLSDEVAARLYPGEFRRALMAKTLDRPDVVMVVARTADGAAVGCCALFLTPDGTGELKRMIVDPVWQGHGVGSRLVDAVCEVAGSRGVATLRLEVGVKNVEAQALYIQAGFRPRGPFGDYGATPISSFMERNVGLTGKVAETGLSSVLR